MHIKLQHLAYSNLWFSRLQVATVSLINRYVSSLVLQRFLSTEETYISKHMVVCGAVKKAGIPKVAIRTNRKEENTICENPMKSCTFEFPFINCLLFTKLLAKFQTHMWIVITLQSNTTETSVYTASISKINYRYLL